ncbi:MAG: aspartate aminotransferase family protein [Clostridia bacterium]|nr:aspartate aminotransferase family protein [Clostridia bacterium]
MNLNEIIALDKKYFMNTFGDRTPVAFSYGRGMYLYSTDGAGYLDFLGGIAVSSLGHSHPGLVDAISEQSRNMIHCSNLYYIENQALLAQEICMSSCADKVFFSNSGAEANEGAIKLARLYHRKKGSLDKYEIITLEDSFHGRTLATIAATGQPKYNLPFSPLTPKFKSVPMNDLGALEKAVDGNTCAIMLEPIQGESGVNPATYEYIKGVRDICDKNDILLIFDEVQCGMGRTGKLYGYMHYDVEPDIFTLAKALGGGFPIGALCAKDFVASAFEPGDHGSTFGGNPLACAAGLAVFRAYRDEKLVEKGAETGAYIFSLLDSLKEKHDVISDVRGSGLMIGMTFNKDIAVEVKARMFDRKILIGSVKKSIIRLLPPLVVKKEHADILIRELDSVLSGITGSKIQ